MSLTSYNFKDHITLDNNKYIKWLDPSGTVRNNVILVNNSSQLYINSVSNGNVYINNNTNTSSKTILNSNTPQPVIIGSKLGIGLSENTTVSPNLALSDNSFIGLTSTIGLLSMCGSNTTDGSSKIQFYGNGNPDTTLQGNLNLYSGNINNINAGIGFYTENNSKKMKIFKDGSIEITPDGNNIKCKITNNTTTFNHDVYITSTTASTNSTTGSIVIQGGVSANGGVCIYNTTQALGYGSGGSLTVLGGASISKDLFVGGTISSRSDYRLKENIKPINSFARTNSSTCDFIKNVKTVEFNYIDDPDIRHIGFIAQDFKYYPELIRRDYYDEYYSLDYSKITVLLVNCIKELKQEIEYLNSKII